MFSVKGHIYGCIEGFQGLIGRTVTAQGNLHTHCDTYTHFLSLREKGQCLEEEMVSHCYD